MKYFIKEELEDITKQLLEKPTRETLKKLNDKYNTETIVEKEFAPENILVQSEPVTIEPIPTVVEVQPIVEIPNEVVEEKEEVVKTESPILESLPNLEVSPSLNSNIQGIELPKLETPVFNNQNNEPANFSGNIFDTPSQPIENLMQTTDNFNSVSNMMPSTEIPVEPAPFFVTSSESVNNPIPVGGPVNNAPMQSPSMFGQFEQNYM